MNKLCRLCGEKSDNGTSIFDKSSSNLQIASTIDQLLGFKVSADDGLPTCICTTCQDFLDKVASFVDSCKKVQERLKVLYNDFTCKEERELFDNDECDASLTFEIICPSDDKSISNPESIEKNDTPVTSLENAIPTNDISPEESKIQNSNEETSSRIPVVKLQRLHRKAEENGTNSDDLVSRKSRRISKLVKFSPESYRSKSTKRVTRSSHSSPSKAQDPEVESPDIDDNDSAISDDDDYNVSDDDGVSDDDDYVSDDNDSDYVHEKSTAKSKTSSSQNDAKPKKSSPKIKSNQKFEKLTCDVCKQNFNHEFVLAEHMNLHTGNRPFTCRLCEKTFRIRKELNAHLRTVHSDKQFPCPMCDYVCKYRGKLTEHVKNIHEKPFVCAICNYRTGLKCKLASHIVRRHKEFTPVVEETAAASFVCEICGSALKSIKSLQSHRMNMHFPEPKQCQMCGVMFPSGARYKSHLQTCGRERKRYPCDECGRSYACKASLDDHMNKHRDIRPYKCDICDRAFRTRTHLDSHKFVHRGPTFHCEICGQRFNRKDNMNVHVRRHYANPDPNLMVLAT